MAHINFFPNFFKTIVPYRYLEDAPVGFRLVNQDANFIRNAGDSISFFLVFEAACLVLGGFLYMLFRCLKKVDAWYPRILRLAAVAGAELMLMNLMHFATTQLRYGRTQLIPDEDFHRASITVAIVAIVLIVVYVAVRLWTSRIGGVNCLKRTLIAVIIALIHSKVLFVLIALEFVYAIARIGIERTHTNALLAVLYAEELLLIVAYLLLVVDGSMTTTVTIVSLVVLASVCALAYGLTEILYYRCDKMHLPPQDPIPTHSIAQ